MLAKSENLNPMTFSVPSCVSKKISLLWMGNDRAVPRFQNYCYCSSGHMRFVDTFRDESNRSSGRNFMIYRVWAFGMNIKRMKKKEKKKRGDT